MVYLVSLMWRYEYPTFPFSCPSDSPVLMLYPFLEFLQLLRTYHLTFLVSSVPKSRQGAIGTLQHSDVNILMFCSNFLPVLGVADFL